MKFAEEALILLDLPTSANLNQRLDRFPDVESIVSSSFDRSVPSSEKAEEITTSNESFTVASRMGRVNYDEQAKAEALVTALAKLRSNNKRGSNGGRVLRRT